MIKRYSLTFPLVFELLIWVFYVAIYKYSYHLEFSGLPHIINNDFPYPELCLYSLLSTLYLIPYYRWAMPKLLEYKRYGWVIFVTVLYFIVASLVSKMGFAWVFSKFTEEGKDIHRHFYFMAHHLRLDWNLILTDTLAFLCLAFSRFSYQNEQKRHQIETDHLHLQLNMLKAQLQPHFLFNTLNSLYGMSLSGGKDTPRFILLLSQMMQYILYDCEKEEVELPDEVSFLKGYFELEQKKFPDAVITFKVDDHLPSLKIPPLLFLPLVENCFKHGRHKSENKAIVTAILEVSNDLISFKVLNDAFPQEAIPNKRGGIGLSNIKKRLELYYRGRNELTLTHANNKFIAELKIKLR